MDCDLKGFSGLHTPFQEAENMIAVLYPRWSRALHHLLEENDQLIRCIVEYQSKGRAAECSQYQQVLHRNLIYLATIADATSPQADKQKT
ncbi:SS18-like protein 2 isoform X1 [Hyla sarda]|uniref:SS18-like protein 2 isoform X1 n=1 Tax=Hyla sarda TaxID=327740 RepID=UPI0024C3E86E|nr:SS18-like protein 2 isoform X1 [Hyla sarda]